MAHTVDSLVDSANRTQLDALAVSVGLNPDEYGTKTELAAAILDRDADAEIVTTGAPVGASLDSPSDGVPSVGRFGAGDDRDAFVATTDPDRDDAFTVGDPVMDASGKEPQRDFLTFADAERQAEILGGVVKHEGVAFSVVEDDSDTETFDVRRRRNVAEDPFRRR